MNGTRRSRATSRGARRTAVLAALLLLAPFLTGAAAAQERPSPALDLSAGWVGFADDGIVGEGMVGAAGRFYLSPRVAVGPELLYISGEQPQPPGADGQPDVRLRRAEGRASTSGHAVLRRRRRDVPDPRVVREPRTSRTPRARSPSAAESGQRWAIASPWASMRGLGGKRTSASTGWWACGWDGSRVTPGRVVALPLRTRQEGPRQEVFNGPDRRDRARFVSSFEFMRRSSTCSSTIS